MVEDICCDTVAVDKMILFAETHRKVMTYPKLSQSQARWVSMKLSRERCGGSCSAQPKGER